MFGAEQRESPVYCPRSSLRLTPATLSFHTDQALDTAESSFTRRDTPNLADLLILHYRKCKMSLSQFPGTSRSLALRKPDDVMMLGVLRKRCALLKYREMEFAP